jgi:hypothetical protein
VFVCAAVLTVQQTLVLFSLLLLLLLHVNKYPLHSHVVPVAVAARFKASVCGRSLPGIASSNSAGGMDVCLL